MISRNLANKLVTLAGYYPVVVVTGPRQSGKTTLCKSLFPAKPYVSLEALDEREYAASDPRAFLAEYKAGAVIDEVQNVPALLSYLQSDVDTNPEPGRFILTGSQHFGLSAAISQSLAGRCGVVALLPPGFDELRAFENAPDELFNSLWQGAYPRIYDRGIPAHQWLADYVATYIQRDVRQVINVTDLLAFTTFLRLCAGRTAQEINLSALGADAGISHNTARAWLSVLETSYILHRVPAWHANVRKQIVKAPKLHFFDSGLVCYLLGIHAPEQLRHHPLRGAIFESWVVSEVVKAYTHRGQAPAVFHYRESRGVEIDLIIQNGAELDAIEIKSGATLANDYFAPLQEFAQRMVLLQPPVTAAQYLVYGGEPSQRRTNTRVLSWRDAYQLASGGE